MGRGRISMVLTASTAVLALLTAACGEDGPAVTAGEDRLAESEAPEQGAVTEAQTVFTDPQAFVGQQVEVTGTVSDRVDDHGFLLTNPALGSNNVLVVAAGGADQIGNDAVVDVAGEVQEFDAAEVGEALGVELDDVLYDAYTGEPVIIADTLSPGTATEDGA